MNKIKFKTKIPNKFIKLNNYFIDQFKKFKFRNEFAKLKNYFIDQFNKSKKPKKFKFKNISNFSLSIILFISLLF